LAASAIPYSQITLAGLIPLSSLPDLEKLSIVLNASAVLDIPPTEVSNTRISSLDFGDSIIQNDHAVAAFLSDVLPNVRTIYS
jgi:hypothetical protein